MESKQQSNTEITGLEIAVIGMAGRFPGANDIDGFWNNLQKGIDSITFFSHKELLDTGSTEELINDPAYVKAKQKVEGKEYFDSSFFGYTPGEARLMDPQVRIFHECVWTALEDAGLNPESYPGLIGVYAGSSNNFAWEAFVMLSHAEGSSAIDNFTALQLRNRDFLTTRVSHKLNLKGPAVFIQTACSTSLVAVHMACRGLLTGDCQVALAGGINISPSIKEGYYYQEGMISSPDGHCRAFDAESKGTISGEGAGIVVLKKMKKAQTDRDNIYAVIKGTAINNDGVRKVGFSAPSVDGQADVIRMAHKISRINARSISYIEAHGTGTVLGDPIEMEALTHVFGTGKEKYCAVGSVKSNIGHLDAAAGAAGLIKTVLALKHKQIPPSLHFKKPNPKLDIDNSPFYINTELKQWRSNGYPLRAGVSSFGIGGTNAHVVLEEAPEDRRQKEKSREYQLILLSANTQSALERMTTNLNNFLKKSFPGQDTSLADMVYTLQTGRQAFSQRAMLVCKDIPQAINILSSPTAAEIKTFTAKKGKKNLVFMFPGQGAQYIDMGRDLYQKEPLFRQEIDRCFEILRTLMGPQIKEVFYPAHPAPPKDCVETPGQDYRSNRSNESDNSYLSYINQTDIAQPLIFVIEYALAKLLMNWGITPDIMMGHSVGEYTAACISGVLSLEDALELVVLRGKLMQGLPGGSMLSVPLSEKELEPLLEKYNEKEEKISIAAVNSPQYCVVSGGYNDIASLERELKEKKCNYRRLHTSHAFHSPMMEPILVELEEAVKRISPAEPGIPYISNLTGKPIEAGEVSDPGYWSKHIRQTVRFSEGTKFLLKKQNTLFIEVGPGKNLSTFIHQQKSKNNSHKTINMLRHPQEKVDDQAYLLEKIGELWLYGFSPDWNAFYEGQHPKKVSLPTYPFDKNQYPVETNLGKLIASLTQTPVPGATGTGLENKEEPIFASPAPIIGERPELTTLYIAPGTPTEERLAEMWGSFFGIKKIGINDDFFELGGDSLKAMTLAAKILQQFQVDVPVADFFAFPTIKGLAERIDSSEKKPFTFIRPVEEKEYYDVSSEQKRLYFQQQMNPDSAAYNMPQSLPLDMEIENPRLEKAFKKLIRRHESLRTSFHFIDGKPVQKIHPDIEFSMEYYDLQVTGASGRRRWEEAPLGHISDTFGGDLATEDTESTEGSQELRAKSHIHSFIRPFDLSQAPLVRLGLIKMTRDQYILLVDIHHIISDGISMGILSNDLMRLFSGDSPPGLKARYRDYTEWQQRLFSSGRIKKQEAYWLKQFEDGVPVLDLPTDYPHPGPDIHTSESGRVIFQIDSQRLEKIKQWAPEQGITLFFVLLAVYYILLAKYSGKEDIVVGTGAAGRKHTELEHMIGLFIDVLAMRNRPGKDKTFNEFLKEVKQNALDAYANEEYPFESLVRTLNIQGNTPDNPLFSVAFELLNVGVPDLADPGEGSYSGFGPGMQTAHYTLTLYCAETPRSVEMTLVYYEKLFKHSTVEKMAEHYLEILNQVLPDKEIKLKDINISTDFLQLKADMLKKDTGDFNF